MERRTEPRKHRRISLVFWDRDDPADRCTGFTSDTSPQGAFITTHRPLRSGTRLQVELDRGTGTFLAEAPVVRSVTVPPDLRKFRPGGMGVLFLGFDALLEELELGGPRSAIAADAQPEPEPAASAAEPSPSRRRTDFERERGGTDPARLHPAASPIRTTDDGDGDGRATTPAMDRFHVAFSSFEGLREVYERDLSLGGLFVPTDSPAPADSRISVRLDLPQGRGSIEVTARVVQSLPVGAPSQSGMGIVIDDATGLAGDLRRILECA
ncbi:MAG TPA: PilZ domain-containing protein [Thermoanaerobaculia bacterium]|nr:PilZ domain-containing protein [Thermoanaerobaculia bacterium]